MIETHPTFEEIHTKGYWNSVFDYAAVLLRSHPEMNGDAAYWKARNLIDSIHPQNIAGSKP